MKDSIIRKAAFKKIAYPFIALIFWVGVWEILSLIIGSDFLLPSPLHVGVRAVKLFADGEFYLSALGSLLRVISGYALGILIGIAFALIMRASRLGEAILSPFLTVIKSTPVASFILVVWVFTPENVLPGIIGALIVIPITAQNVSTGIANIDQKSLEVATVYGFNKKQRILHCYIPSVYPYFSSAATVSLGMAWKAGVAAEVLAYVKSSLGRAIYLSKSNLDTELLFAYTTVIIVLSLIIEWGVRMIFERVDMRFGK
ncbi:MAG: ABC transporter permease subunit [Clostridia bacterium]|nr:ABC transporter permease subunit [Clostridia bacterium]